MENNIELELERLNRLNEKRAKEILVEEKELDDFYSNYESFTNYFKIKINEYKDLRAIVDNYTDVNLTYGELEDNINNFASGLQSLGVKKGDFVALFSENNGRWVIIDQAIARNGAISTLRGINVPIDELEYILEHSESVGVILQNKVTFEKLKSTLNKFNHKFIILMFDNINNLNEKDVNELQTPIYSFDDIILKGKEYAFKEPKILRDDSYSMSYTSGTTGNPKGVLITHKNILSQVYSLDTWLNVKPKEKSLEI